MVRWPTQWGVSLKRRPRYLFLIPVLLVALGLGLSACSTGGAKNAGEGLRPYTAADTEAAAQAAYPSYVTSQVRDAYGFAVAHPEVLSYMPCYCGCGLTVGHASNLDCFIAGVATYDRLVFDPHAVNCYTCLDIARDAERLLHEGKPLRDIRSYVDLVHGQKGPGTDTPRPAE